LSSKLIDFCRGIEKKELGLRNPVSILSQAWGKEGRGEGGGQADVTMILIFGGVAWQNARVHTVNRGKEKRGRKRKEDQARANGPLAFGTELPHFAFLPVEKEKRKDIDRQSDRFESEDCPILLLREGKREEGIFPTERKESSPLSLGGVSGPGERKEGKEETVRL